MKPRKFEIVFKSGQIEYVFTFSVPQAKILGQAEQIKKGNTYDVDYVLPAP